MKKKILILPTILFFLILSIFFYLLIIERNPSEIPSNLINEKVPTFKAESLFKNEKFISSNEFKNEITLVNFFATWCKPCRDEHVYIKRFTNKKDLKIIGINYRDNPKKTIKWLKELGNPYEDILIDKTANDISNGLAIGWFQGRMEFGPRALGGRSIIGDPRSSKMQKNLNLKVKYRESFRPFAPSVLLEDVSEWFKINTESPYMLLVAPINEKKQLKMSDQQNELFGIEKLNISRSEIPAVTHVDYSARIQTVNKETNPKYFKLISKFKEKTGCPVIVNTSFNVRGEPIVNTPEDAFNCFMGNELDKLVIGNCYLDKQEQNPNLKKDYSEKFELD